MEASSRQAKSAIVANIYDHIRQNATKPSSGFVRKDLLTRRWLLVSEKEARHKVGQALRDAIKIIRSEARKADKVDSVVPSNNQKKRKSSSLNTDAYQNEEVVRNRTTSSLGASSKQKMGNVGQARAQPEGIGSSGGAQYSMAGLYANQQVVASRLFGNQAQALGSFPLNTGGLNAGNFDDVDGPTMNAMLETSIEPIDKRAGETQRLSDMDPSSMPAMDPFGFTSDGLQNPFGIGQDLIHAAKRNGQFSGGTSSGLEIDPRFPLLHGDNHSISGINPESPCEWHMRLDPHYGAPQFPSNVGTQVPPSGSLPPYLMQRSGLGNADVKQPNQKEEQTSGQSDILEPTPFLNRGQRHTSSEQRASALAQLLWPDDTTSRRV